jgi:hypothetical protein
MHNIERLRSICNYHNDVNLEWTMLVHGVNPYTYCTQYPFQVSRIATGRHMSRVA